MKIVVFAGTTEGKQAAMLFGAAGHDVVVTVATDYGRQVFEESLKGQNIQLLEGRLNQSQMRELIRHQDLVVDATHPYAVEVSHNIVAACQEENKNYLRILRDHEQEQDYQDVILPMENIQQVIDWLNQHSGKVLLTTGSKDLKTYAQIHDYHNRLYPRILPDINSLEMAMDQGYKKSNIICMQGPFTTQINVAMLEMIGASYLVTKETGGSGGYLQKLEACKELGIRAIVIKRPVEEIEKISKSQNMDENSWHPTETTTETTTENKIENKIENKTKNTAEKSNSLMTGVSLKILESYLYAHSDVDLTAIQAYQEEIENQKNDSSHALKEDGVQNNTMDSKSSKSGSLKQQDNNQDDNKETSGKAQELEDLKLREMTQVTVPQVDFVNPPRFPIFLNLKDHLVTVIGSGNIARRRIKALLSYGAKVRVISPHASDNLQMAGILDWEKDKAQGYSGSIRAIDRAYQENDLEGAVLAVAATNDRQVNHQVYEEAQRRGIFVSVADKKEESSYYFPALWTGEGLSVGIVGDGENHSYVKESAQTIRNALDEIQFGKKEKE